MRNLYTWTPWIGWDPEQNYVLGSGAGDASTNGGTVNFPNVRTIVGGLNISLR